MALSGSCPGTLLAQTGAGLQTGFYGLAGAVLGGIAYTGFVSKVVKWQKERTAVKPEIVTIDQQLGLSPAATLVLFEALALSAVAASVLLVDDKASFTLFSAGSGLFLGFAQLFSLLARKSMLGVSGSYEEAGRHFWWLVGGARRDALPASRQNMVFASGVAVGAWVVARTAPSLLAESIVEVAPGLAVAGGFLMVIGARVAGGCTSGHGISGLSLFSVSSFVTIATLFLTGGVLAPLIHK